MANYQKIVGDNIQASNGFAIIYNNKNYGSDISLLQITNDTSKQLNIVQTFNFNVFIRSWHVRKGIITFLDDSNDLYELDVNIYTVLANSPELAKRIDPDYLLSQYKYNSDFPITKIYGRVWTGSEYGLIITGLIKR